MMRQWWLGLLWNAALLVTLAAAYGLLAEWAGRRRPLGRIATGTAFGLVAVLVMSAPLQLASGLQYDGRSVVISMAGLFGGGISAALAGSIAAAYRVWLGGIGVIPGLGTILTSALAGWAWRRHCQGRVTSIREWHLLAFGLALHVAVLGWQGLLPGAYRTEVLLGVGPAFLTVFPLGTMLLGWLLAGVERRHEERSRDLEGHLREITRLHRELEQRHRGLQALHRELGLQVSMTAHDLKAPLRAIQGFTEALNTRLTSRPPEENRALVDRILQAAGRMEGLLLELERYGHVIQAPVAVRGLPIRPLVDRVIAELPTPQADARPRISCEGPEDLAVRGDRALLERALQNLLSNAMKFVRPKEPPQVTIRWRRAGPGRVRLDVADRGIGVPEDRRERIFDPFERLHGRETYPGTGLGLAMVRRAAERMEGRCGMEPRPGGGSVFFLELPEAEEAS